MAAPRSNTCPYCGGPYTLARTCHGPRTDTPGENACPDLARAAAAIAAAAAADEMRQDV
jgi:hypothetical protein